MNILVLNSGSSSLKYKLFDMEQKNLLASGVAERIGSEGSFLTQTVPGQDKVKVEKELQTHRAALEEVLDLLTGKDGVISCLSEIKAVGHRVLHGKETYSDSILLDDEKMSVLKSFVELGPLHMPANLMGIEACVSLMPGVPQVAVFDTAFHQTIPERAYLYALPYELYEKYGLRRYGFHGISHKYVSRQVAKKLGRPLADLKLITLHLGNGCSMAAISGGKVVDTTMGFTPLEGLVMGTRCGDLDPAIVPFLQDKLGMSNGQIDSYLNKQSGLLGVSGLGNDMRDIQQARLEGNKRAELAYQVFVYRILKYVGAYAMAMGGLDTLVFTAGVGENDDLVRADVCKGLSWMGLSFDAGVNTGLRGKEAVLTTPDSKIQALVIPTNEELMIAEDTYRIVG